MARHLDHDLAGNDEVHAVGILVAADDRGSGFHPERPQDEGHAGDARGGQMPEKRHLGDELPGDDEVSPAQFLDESRGDDARRHGEAEDAEDGAERTGGAAEAKITRLAPGAIALHLHSFSGASLHNPEASWAPWLVEQGAGLTFGNVYEPYLSLTVRPDRLLQGLRQGLSAGEAAWFATPSVSWQGIVLGDPFYQPYAVPLADQAKAAGGADPLGDYALLRQFNLLPRPLSPEDLRRFRETAERTGRLPLLLECCRAEQAAGINRPWRDPKNLAAEDGGLIQEAARFVEGRFGVAAAQKLRAELAKRPEWAPAPPPGSEKPAKR